MKFGICGTRNLTVDNCIRAAKYVGFGEAETDFFLNLVHYNQTEDPHSKKYFKERLDAFRKTKPESYEVTARSDILNRWYIPAVLVSLHEMVEDKAIKSVVNMVGIAEKDAKDAIKSLIENKYVSIRSGKFKLENTNPFAMDKKSQKESYRKFLEQHLKISLQKINQAYGEKSKFYSQTLAISKDSYGVFASKVKNFLEEFTHLADAENVENIVQLNIQFFEL